MLNEKKTKILSQDEKIALGQCFNLAHKEMVEKRFVTDEIGLSFIEERTIQLYNLKQKIDRKITES